MPDLKTNVLYCGDNSRILRKQMPDESVNVTYLEPAFNSS